MGEKEAREAKTAVACWKKAQERARNGTEVAFNFAQRNEQTEGASAAAGQ